VAELVSSGSSGVTLNALAPLLTSTTFSNQNSKDIIMKITVIGAGNMGAAFVKRLQAVGHEVTVTSKDMSKANALAAQFPSVTAKAAGVAAEQAEVLILATGYGDAVSALKSLGDLTGKVVVDITNPLTADYMGLTIGQSTSAGEEIARAVPASHVVKAFNTVFASVLGEGLASGATHQVTVFVAGDNDNAKQAVKQMVSSLGFEIMDAGSLKNARYLEPLAGLNIYFGYGAGMGTQIAPTWIRQA
jgi:8-hydroxy-5-deazaflavin:NADPH oxidoreductase